MKLLFLLLLLPLGLSGQDWTMLVYIAADNGLAQWADSDLVEMEQYGSNQNINVVVQIDKPSIGAQRLFVNQGTSHVLQDLGIIDMCAWETLSNFLYWGISSFPAERYLVILWDHGTGWTAMPQRSFGSDWSSGNVLSISNGDFQKALSNAYEFTDTRIDLFAFDACLMQQVEVGFELAKYARVLLAPQSIMPLAGLRYDEILESLHADPGIGSTELSRHMIQSTINNYAGIQPIAISSVNLARLNTLGQDFAALAKLLMYATPNSLALLRQTVQTIPAIGCIPDTTDDFIDLGDFLAGLGETFSYPEVDRITDTYNKMVIHADFCGQDFANTTGLTVWFPGRYLQFKQLLGYYERLDWNRSQWLEFLNWFYGSDDIRPSVVSLQASSVGANNDFRLHWTKSYDLSAVTYHVVEAIDTTLAFNDQCENASLWDLSGFTLSSVNAHSGTCSFFSGNASNLRNYMETQNNITIEHLGLLKIWLHHNIEEPDDSLIIQYGPFEDIHYGVSNGWVERRVILPSGNHRIRISYHTSSAGNMGGCYIDDVTLHNLDDGYVIREAHQDTSLYLYNELRGRHLYTVYAEDRYKNTANVSNVLGVSVTEYAAPYSIPNPFQSSCYIALDYPDTLHPEVEVYSLSGSRVKRFEPNQIANKKIFWDGKDEDQRDVGAGLYIVLVKDKSFKKIGKIARQR
jgi:hypothetical protein